MSDPLGGGTCPNEVLFSLLNGHKHPAARGLTTIYPHVPNATVLAHGFQVAYKVCVLTRTPQYSLQRTK